MRARPNIVFIFSDQHRARTTGYEGAAVETPAMDRLAAEGVVFDTAVSSIPVCTPWRAALLTGQYPAHQRRVPQRRTAAHRPADPRHHPPRRRLRHRLHRQVAPGRQPPGRLHAAGPAPPGIQLLGRRQLHARLPEVLLLPGHAGAAVVGRLRRRCADRHGRRLHRLAARGRPVRPGAFVGAAAQPVPRRAAGVPGPLSRSGRRGAGELPGSGP